MADLFGLSALMVTFASLALVVLAAILLVFLAVYIYQAIALMTIAKKTKTKLAWLAWIPIANLYLITKIGKTPWWTILFLLFAWLSVIGPAIIIGLIIYWWWNIAEKRKMPGWLGILMAVPVVNLVVLGIIAWKK